MRSLRSSQYYFLSTIICYALIGVTTMVTAQGTISIPNSDNELNDYLCGSQSSQIVSQTTLKLSSNEEHVIPSNQFCVLLNKEGIVLQSSGPVPAVVRCEGDGATKAGFGFVRVSQLTIKNIRFENCGGVILQNSNEFPSTMFAPPQSSPANVIRNQQQAVLLLSYCSNVNITNVTVNNYHGYAIYAINIFGKNNFSHVTITNSYAFQLGTTSSDRNDLLESGSGMYIHFIDSDSPQPVSYSIVYITGNTKISNNWNVYPTFLLESLLSVRLQNQPGDFPLPGSGALTVYLEQRTFRVKLFLENTETRNNAASTGGSTKINSRNTINNFDLNITNCTFINNSIFKYSNHFRGAGIQMYFVFSYDKLRDVTATAGVDKASIFIADSAFVRNSAMVGAGIAVFCEAQNVSEIEVNLKSIQFIENEASDEGDCVSAQREQSAYYQARNLVVTLESITVMHSGSATYIDVDRSAALSFVNAVAKINGSTANPSIISNGNNSAVKAFSTRLFLSKDMQFIRNTALHGGAVSLEANSFLFFVEPTNILFAQNRASRGGAIYSDFTSGDRCVMQFTMLSRNYDESAAAFNVSSLRELDFNITFIDNLAEDGNATYAQPIFNCSWYSESIVQFPSNQVEEVYDTLFKFLVGNKSDSYKNQIRSHPQRPCFCRSFAPVNEYVCLNNTEIERVTTFPGKSFTVNLIPVDHLSHPLRSVVEARIIDQDLNSVRFKNKQRRDVRDLNGTTCYASNYTLENAENATVSVKFGSLETNGLYVEIQVYLEECPFGFEFNKESGVCDCIPLYTNNSIACNIENGVFTKTNFEDSIYWIGRTDFNGDTVSAYADRCPEGYCVRNKTLNLDLLNKTLCVGNRANEMCGQCIPGMSMKFGTTDCGSCSNYWLFTLVLYVLAGILLVFVLFLLKMTISNGTLISVFFYAQLFSINLSLLAGMNQIRFATVFISLLNLELGFPICFYNGMDFAGKLGFQFVFPLYLWIIVGIITYLCRHSSRLSALIGSECVKVFVTLFYLSYTKIVRTTFEVFVWGTIETEKNNKIIVWFFDGSVHFFTDWKHLLLILVSLVMFLVVINPYKFFLFLSQWCLHNPWISRHFKPLIDANLAPFKDRYRFWLGMRLFITEVLILISIIFTSINPKIVAFTHVAIVMVLMMFQAYIRPYKSKFVNILDLFFIINFLLFVTSCVFLYVVVFTPGTVVTTSNPYLFAVEIIYVGSAFLVFIGIIIYHAVARVKSYRNKRGHMASKLNQPTVSVVEMNGSESISLQPPQSDQTTVIMNHSDDEFMRLREPLLED